MVMKFRPVLLFIIASLVPLTLAEVPSHRLAFTSILSDRSANQNLGNRRMAIASQTTVEDNERGANNQQVVSTETKTTKSLKRLLCVRHGISVANEYMSQPGNEWGDPTFKDDPTLVDARLSPSGQIRTSQDLPNQLVNEDGLWSILQEIELVLISPLTRCLETYTYGVEPILKKCFDDEQFYETRIPVLAIPLLRERVYTASDTGRPSSVLEKEFPTVNFEECKKLVKNQDGPNDEEGEHHKWWYHGSNDDDEEEEEWRPHGDGQWYAAPGEPEDVFDLRIKELDEWLSQRHETNILMVTHWGVLRHLTSGTEWNNGEAKLLEWEYCSHSKSRRVSHLVSSTTVPTQED
jgi:broad specificity phosphatase PhoE